MNVGQKSNKSSTRYLDDFETNQFCFLLFCFLFFVSFFLFLEYRTSFTAVGQMFDPIQTSFDFHSTSILALFAFFSAFDSVSQLFKRAHQNLLEKWAKEKSDKSRNLLNGPFNAHTYTYVLTLYKKSSFSFFHLVNCSSLFTGDKRNFSPPPSSSSSSL